MAVNLPNGSLIHIGSAYGSAVTVSAATNASPAVLTATAHGLADGDYIVLTTGWSRLNGRTFRVDNCTTNTFELEGIDTTNTSVFASGSGTGSFKKVTSWTRCSRSSTPRPAAASSSSPTTSSSRPTRPFASRRSSRRRS